MNIYIQIFVSKGDKSWTMKWNQNYLNFIFTDQDYKLNTSCWSTFLSLRIWNK